MSSSLHSQEEGISRNSTHEQFPSAIDPPALSTKGKGKERQLQREYTDSGSDEAAESSRIAAYPPTTDEDVESRRVEETLRTWETAERQRRKAVRESAQYTNAQHSLVSDISRRASLLWPGRKSKHPSISGLDGLGNHTVLDPIDTLPLTDVNLSPTPSPTAESDDARTDNPFAGPPESLSPFADSHEAKLPDTHPSIPVNHHTFPSSIPTPSRLPPPKPLGLPPPRTPPPPISSPPLSTPSPNTATGGTGHDAKSQDYRWWHDWLCGCGEGADRGGDYQAGRTNPFE